MLSLFHFFSWIGDWERVLLVGLVIFIIFFRMGWQREALMLTFAVGLAKVVSILLKYLFAAERPGVELWLTEASGFSFPSGHATVALALYGGLGYILWKKLSGEKERYLAVLFAVIMILGISFSRIILGVHWPSDILGGWGVGTLSLLITFGVLKERFQNMRLIKEGK